MLSRSKLRRKTQETALWGLGSPVTPVRMSVHVCGLLCFGVTGVKYPTWAPHCLGDFETDPQIMWDVAPRTMSAEILSHAVYSVFQILMYIILCVFVCESVSQHPVCPPRRPSISSWQTKHWVSRDQRAEECCRRITRRLGVSHNHRQTARAGMQASIQTLQPRRLHCSWGEHDYTAIDG